MKAPSGRSALRAFVSRVQAPVYRIENACAGGRHAQRLIKALGRREVVENSNLLGGLIATAVPHVRRSLSSVYRGDTAASPPQH